jgi:hypothetical protein
MLADALGRALMEAPVLAPEASGERVVSELSAVAAGLLFRWAVLPGVVVGAVVSLCVEDGAGRLEPDAALPGVGMEAWAEALEAGAGAGLEATSWVWGEEAEQLEHAPMIAASGSASNANPRRFVVGPV